MVIYQGFHGLWRDWRNNLRNCMPTFGDIFISRIPLTYSDYDRQGRWQIFCFVSRCFACVAADNFVTGFVSASALSSSGNSLIFLGHLFLKEEATALNPFPEFFLLLAVSESRNLQEYFQKYNTGCAKIRSLLIPGCRLKVMSMNL